MPEMTGRADRDRFSRLTLNADLLELSKARALMKEVGLAAGLSDDRIFDLQVAVSEAVANAIEHAASSVDLATWLLPDRLVVEVTNEGLFQPGLYKDNAHRRRGLGLPLMVSLADQVHVSRLGTGGTLVSLTFFLHSDAARSTTVVDAPESAIAQLEAEHLKVRTALVRAEQAEAEARRLLGVAETEKERLEKLLHSITDEVWFADADRRFTLANAAAFQGFGLDAAHPLGMEELAQRSEVYRADMTPRPSEEAPPSLAFMGEVVRNQEEIVRIPESGELRHRLVNATPVRDADGSIIGVVSVVRDITELKQAEESLRESERRFRLALKNAPVSVAAQDCDLRFIWAHNLRTTQPEAVVGRTDEEVFTPEDAERLIALKRKVLETGEDLHEKMWLTRNGTPMFLDVYLEATRDAAGGVNGIGIVTVDLTEMKRVEETLRQSEERYQLLFENMADGFAFCRMLYDDDGRPVDYRFLEVNAAFERLIGLPRIEVAGRNARDLIPNLQPQAIENLSRVVATGEPIRFDNFSIDLGTWFDVLAYRPAPGHFAYLCRDLTERRRTDEALKKSDERMKVALTSAQVTAYEVDREQRYVWVHNPHPAASAQAAIGMTSSEVFSSPEVEQVIALRRQVIETGEPVRRELTLPLFGETRTYDYSIEAVRNESGEISGALVAAVDITERKAVEVALKSAKDFAEGLIETANAMVLGLDLEGNVILANEATLAVTGYSRSELMGQNWSLVLPEESRADLWQVFSGLTKGGSLHRYENPIITKSGEERYIVWQNSVVREQGQITSTISFGIDITERRKAEEEVRDLSQRLTYHMEHSPLAVVEWGPDMRLIRWSGEAERIFGWRADEVLGKRIEDLRWVYEEDQAQISEVQSDLQSGSNPRRFSLNRNYRKDGTVVYCEWHNSSLVDEKGNLKSILSLVLDVTDRERLFRELSEERDRLQKLEEQQRLLVRGAPAAIYEIDFEGPRFVSVNDWVCEQSGYSREELLELSPFELLDEESQARFRKRIQMVLAGEAPEETVEYTAVAKDGRKMSSVLNISLIYEDGRPKRALVVGHDITERKRVETALAKSESSLAAAQRIGHVGSWEWNIQTGDLQWSAELFAIYGLDPEVHRPNMQSFADFVHPDDLDLVNSVIARALSDGRPVNFDFRIIAADGSIRDLSTSGEITAFDKDGHPLTMVGVNQDITERKRAEAADRANQYNRSLIEAALDPLVTIGPDGRITDVNEATAKITGRARDELIGTDFSDYFTDPASARRGYRDVFAKGSVTDYPLTICGPNGKRTDVLYNASLYRDQDGKVLGVFAAARDITQLEELEGQRRIATTLQRALLDVPDQLTGVEFGHLYRSATKEASIGGDFYDVFQARDGRIGLLIGDVSGHGVEAARIATLVKDVVHAFAHQFRRPSVILQETNELLIEKGIPGFVTLFLGILDASDGLLTYSSAGHPNAIRRMRGGEVQFLQAGSPPLGVFAGHSWEEYRVGLDPVDLLVLYTDGITEARRDGEFFGEDGLAEVVRRWSDQSPELLPDAVLTEVLGFSEGVLRDDVALVALRLSGVAGDTGSR